MPFGHVKSPSSNQKEKTFVESLKYKTMRVGMKILGVVVEVSERGLVLSLPNGLKGNVTRAEAGDAFENEKSSRSRKMEVDEDDEEETEKVEEILETCSDHLSKSYEMAIKEAIQYDGDDYPDHTLESYMKENASLVASLSAQSCEDCYSEIKDEDLTKEMYEAILNEMKESYVKKIEEMKESWVG